MMIRSMTLILALGAGMATAAAAPSSAPTPTTQSQGGGFDCQNKLDIQVVSCTGAIAILPVTVDIKNIGVLDDSDLNILSDDLDNLSLKDINILDGNKILNDVEVTVLQSFLDKIGIDVTKNDVDVCATVLGGLLCK
jgi:hypothetical protein